MTTALNHQQHRSTGTALGRRLRMYRSTPAVGGTSRRVSFIRALGGYDLPDCNLAGALIGPGSFLGNRRDGNRTLASVIHQSADHSLNYRAKPLKRHFIASSRYVHQRSPGARNEVTHHQSIWYPHDR